MVFCFVFGFQFLWTDFGHKYFHRRDHILHSYMHWGTSPILTFDRQYAGMYLIFWWIFPLFQFFTYTPVFYEFSIFFFLKTYLQSMTVKLEEWRVKRRDTEEWMRHRHLPPGLQERVRRFVQYQWLATRGVNEESILQSLPLDLRREIQRHLCLGLVRRVSNPGLLNICHSF